MTKKTQQPASLNLTLKALETALNDWGKTLADPEVKNGVNQAKSREVELSRQAKMLFSELKKQIDDLSE